MRHLKLRTICRGGVHKEIGLNGAAVISCIFKAKKFRYEVPEKAQRPVAYADKQELEEAIIRRHYASSIEDEENQVDQGAAAAGGLSQGMRPEANRRKPALRP